MKRAGFLLALMVVTMLCAQTINLQPEQTGLTVISDSPGRLDLRLEINEINIGKTSVNGTQFNTLSIGDWNNLTQTGYPALPQFGKRIAVPRNASVSISMSNVKRTTISDIFPFPAQPPALDEVGAKTPPFSYNADYYQRGSRYPEKPILEQDRGIVRGVELALVRFAPVSWDASTHELTIIESCDITITYSAGSLYDERLHSRWFDSLYRQRILNKEQLTPANPSRNLRDIGADLVIITSEEMQNAAEALQEWKQETGFITEIAYVETIGNDADDISDYLDQAYEDWDIPPSFVIFLGDSDIVPCDYLASAISSGSVGTDLPYLCMDGYWDYYPDIASGRISVDDDNQAMLVVQKIIHYESNPPEQTSFYQHATVAGYFQDNADDYNYMDGYEDRRFVKTSEEIRDWLLDEGYDVERIYYTPDDRNPTNYNSGSYANGEPIPNELLRENGFGWDGEDGDISAAIQSGTFILNHRDHGISRNYTYDDGSDPSFDGWGDPHYDTDDIESLSNGDLLPFVFSINCQTGWFDGETDQDQNKCFESFCEEFIRHEDGGAVGAFGASRTSLSGYNDMFVRGYFDSMWENFMPDYSNMESGGHSSIAMLSGLIAMEDHWDQGLYSEYTFAIFHNFGDPTLRIWRRQPTEITVEHPASLELSTTQFPITVSETGAIATLSFNGEILARTEVESNTFNLVLDVPLEIPGIAVLTVDKRDFLVYRSEIDIVPPSSGFILVDSLSVADANGNQDGECDAGEEIGITIHFRNAGTVQSDPVTVSLSPDNFIELSEESFNVSGIEAGQTGSHELTGTLSAQCENMQEVVIGVSIVNEAGEYSEGYAIPVVRLPKMITEVDSVYTQIDEPDQMQIPLTLENVGGEALEFDIVNYSNQAADLTNPDSYVTLPTSDAFNNLNEMTFMTWFRIPEGCTPGYLLFKGDSFVSRCFQLAIPNMNAINYSVLNQDGSNFNRNLAYSLEPDQWYHFAVTVSEDGMRSFINGIMVAEDDFEPPVRYNDETFYVGSTIGGAYEFNGFLDGLAFFSEALLDTQIMEMSFHINPDAQPNLIAYFPLDNTTGTMDVVTGETGSVSGDVSFDIAGSPMLSWMGCNPISSEIPAHDQMDVELTFAPEDFQDGLYESFIEIQSNSAYGYSVIIPVTMYYTYQSIEDQPEPVSSHSVSLLANPFTPGLRNGGIRLNLPEPVEVEIALYNIKGQKVRQLVSSEKIQGSRSIVWDGKDYSGKTVRSGVYFARVITGNKSVIKKMLLIR